MSTRSIWEELNVDPTADAAQIRKAYAAELKRIKRGMDPQQFQALRSAYERALAIAQSRASRGAISPRSFVDVGQHRPAYAAATVRFAAQAPDTVTPPESPPGPERRIHEAVARIAQAVAAGDDEAAAASFAKSHEEFSDLMDGISIDAMGAFERAVVTLILKDVRSRPGNRFIHEAARRFDWENRERDFTSSSDGMMNALRGFLEVRELEQAAAPPFLRPSGLRDFAKAMVGPVKPWRFARLLLNPDTESGWRRRFEQMGASEAQPLRWLPRANVEWWSRALAGPRVMPLPMIKTAALVVASTVPLGLAVAGVVGRENLLVTLAVLFAIAVGLYFMACVQDFRPFVGVRGVARLWSKTLTGLRRPMGIPGMRGLQWRVLVYPLCFAGIFVGFEGMRSATPTAASGLIVGYLWVVGAGILLGVAGLTCILIYQLAAKVAAPLPGGFRAIAQLTTILLVSYIIIVVLSAGHAFIYNADIRERLQDVAVFCAGMTGILIPFALVYYQLSFLPESLKKWLVPVFGLGIVWPCVFLVDLARGQTVGSTFEHSVGLLGGGLALVTLVTWGWQARFVYADLLKNFRELDEGLIARRLPGLARARVDSRLGFHAAIVAIAIMIVAAILKPDLKGVWLATAMLAAFVAALFITWSWRRRLGRPLADSRRPEAETK